MWCLTSSCMHSSLSHRNYIADTKWSNKRQAGVLNSIVRILAFLISLVCSRSKVVPEMGTCSLYCWNMNRLLPANNDDLGSVRRRVLINTALKSVITTHSFYCTYACKRFSLHLFPIKNASVDGWWTHTNTWSDALRCCWYSKWKLC